MQHNVDTMETMYRILGIESYYKPNKIYIKLLLLLNLLEDFDTIGYNILMELLQFHTGLSDTAPNCFPRYLLYMIQSVLINGTTFPSMSCSFVF